MELLAISPYLITIFIAWFGSHAIKYTISLIKHEKLSLRSNMFISGGMPSSHSATAVSLMTIIGLKVGFDSALFGLALLFSLIVMYDALKVRRSSGEQGVALIALLKEQNSKIKVPYVVKGHTLLEVVIGAFLGVIIGAVVFFATF